MLILKDSQEAQIHVTVFMCNSGAKTNGGAIYVADLILHWYGILNNQQSRVTFVVRSSLYFSFPVPMFMLSDYHVACICAILTTPQASLSTLFPNIQAPQHLAYIKLFTSFAISPPVIMGFSKSSGALTGMASLLQP